MDLEPRLKSALSRVVLCVCLFVLFCFVCFLTKKNYQINCPFFQEHGFNFFAMTHNAS